MSIPTKEMIKAGGLAINPEPNPHWKNNKIYENAAERCWIAMSTTTDTYTSPLRELARQLRATAKAHPSYSQVCDIMNVVESHIHAMARCEEVNRNHKGSV